MSIVRVGLAETKKYAAGYDTIFARKSRAAKKARPVAKKKSGKKKK
jgi:hypothetical protein